MQNQTGCSETCLHSNSCQYSSKHQFEGTCNHALPSDRLKKGQKIISHLFKSIMLEGQKLPLKAEVRVCAASCSFDSIQGIPPTESCYRHHISSGDGHTPWDSRQTANAHVPQSYLLLSNNIRAHMGIAEHINMQIFTAKFWGCVSSSTAGPFSQILQQGHHGCIYSKHIYIQSILHNYE